MPENNKIIEPIDADFDAVAKAMTAVDEPTRIEILGPEDATDKFLFYSEGEGSSEIRVFVDGDDTWITQAAMTEVFDVSKSTISHHLANIFESGEIPRNSTVRKIRTVQTEGARNVARDIEHYNLDVILAVGYRTNSLKAIRFRQWASRVLREYLIKGFAMDDDRLKQGKQLFGKDYFDELLERIRDIRASERRFYQKITDVYIQCSYDYDEDAELTHKFFAHAQNKLEYAVTGMTAAEIVKLRADYKLPHMGLTTWKNQKGGGKVTKADVCIAKNYLTETEIKDLNKLVSMFLDYAENLAQKNKRMSMKDWHDKLDDFLKFNEYQILQNYGKIKKDVADRAANVQFAKFKPLQDAAYKSDFDKVVERVASTKVITDARPSRAKKAK
jgi:hypothetical protein